MNWHIVWLWLWYLLGMGTYWLKRAYYGINPPNPVATGYLNYLQRAWVPLIVRAFLESMVFWIMFTPGMADRLLAALGWEGYGSAVQLVTQVPPIAAVFGHTLDSIMDMAVSKIPLINQVLPQMPGPLPQAAVVEAQVVRQTTEVTQLQTTTTTVPKEAK
jgi:hypothetical protein